MRLSSGIVLLLIWVVTVAGLCPENCQVIQKPPLPTCNPDTGACSRGCKVGYYGSTCNMTCNANCQPGTCQQRDGSCTCEPGYTFNAGSCDFHEGVSCKSNKHCLNNTCRYPDRPDCLKGCRPGWFGKFCQQRCSPHCNCDEVTGVCNNCILGWYGADCGSGCSAGCVNKNCHRNGTCIHGCTTGTYGDQCNMKCSKHCVSGCDQLSGECVQCEAGRYGSTCQSECSAWCAGADNDCDRDGTCINGCVMGYYDYFCNQTCEHCKDGDCEQETGECRQNGGKREKLIGEESWVGGSVAVICIISIAAGLFYLYRRLKRVNGVVYDIVKWRRPSPSAVEDVRPVATPGCIELEEEASTSPPRVCQFRATRQTSYIEPRHSGGSRNNLQIQRQLQVAGVSDEHEDTIRHLYESQVRPGSYMLPNYCEVNEELMATLPQPAQGAQAPAPVVMNSSFSVAAGVHTDEVDFNIPLIADCFDSFENKDSSPDEDNQPCVENYDHLLRDSKTQISQATAFGYSQIDDEIRIIQPMVHPIITAKPGSDIKPRRGSTVPTQQHLLSARVSDQHVDEPQGPASPSSDRLLQEVPMATLPQPAQGAVMAAAVVKKSSLSDVTDVHKTEEDIRIPLIAECFGPTEGEDSSPDEDSNQLVENYDHLFRDHYMEH